MQASDLTRLCSELICEDLPRQSKEIIGKVSHSLKYASDRKIDKDGEKRVKQMLYKLETMVREIKNNGLYSPDVLKATIASETRLIMKDLTPYSENEKSLTKRETMVGKEFHNKKEELIKLLLDSNSGPIVVILGKPGTGKTTLIRDVLYDSRVQDYFNQIDTGAFALLSHNNLWEANKKLLTVVDDRTDKDEVKSLLSLDEIAILNSEIFKSNAKGSKIVITSSLDLDYIGESKLNFPSLDEDESWKLFQKIASVDQESPRLTTGRKICQKCEKIPGVINIVASILPTKSTVEEWEHFLYVVMTSVPDPITTISSTIEFTKPLTGYKKIWRHCFAWCSLLPKDFEFRKDHLFQLWRAQEDFNPNVLGITEEQLEDCFKEFFRRGYFRKTDNTDCDASYKIDNLLFELMKYVAGEDFCLLDKTTPEPNHKIIRHASFSVDPSWEPPSWLLTAKQLQSLLLWPLNSDELIPLSKIDKTVERMTQLRIFYAEVEHYDLYPAFLAKLKRLKHMTLGLVSSKFALVSSILIPEDIEVLQKLLNIDLRYISIKTLVPNSVGSLTNGNFGVEERLALLIKFTSFNKMTVLYESGGDQDLGQTNKVLGSLNLQSSSFDENDWRQTSLNPEQSLKNLVVHGWKGETLPAWVIDESSVILSSLLSIQIDNCSGCKHLPGFNTLPLLSSLQLWSLHSLIDVTVSGYIIEGSSRKSLYPSLKCLVLYDLPVFKGWLSKESGDSHHIQLLFSPLLTEIRVERCPEMILMPLVPKLESLKAVNVNVKTLHSLMFPPVADTSPHVDSQELKITEDQYRPSQVKNLEIDGCKEFDWGETTDDNDENGYWNAIESLHSLKITNIPELTLLPRNHQCFKTLEQLSLCWLVNLEILPEWIGLLTQLRELTIRSCPKLIMFPELYGSFSALEQLEIRYCPRLSQFPESLPNLKRLQVEEFGRLKGILRASLNLEELEINNCDELEGETMSDDGDDSEDVWERLSCLHSLKLIKMDTYPPGLDLGKLPTSCRLIIEKCPNLAQHIPNIVTYDEERLEEDNSPTIISKNRRGFWFA